jgi:hypothetical protein
MKNDKLIFIGESTNTTEKGGTWGRCAMSQASLRSLWESIDTFFKMDLSFAKKGGHKFVTKMAVVP